MKKTICPFLVGVLILLAFGGIAFAGDCNTCPSKYETDKAYFEVVYREAVTDRDYNKFYVDGIIWRSCNLKQKKTLSYILACWVCHSGYKYISCVIIDDHTGKKLAKVGAFGFKIY